MLPDGRSLQVDQGAHRTIKSRLFCYSLTSKTRSIGFGKYGTGNTGLAISTQFRRRNAESRLAAVVCE
jgi:hypothetical protein